MRLMAVNVVGEFEMITVMPSALIFVLTAAVCLPAAAATSRPTTRKIAYGVAGLNLTMAAFLILLGMDVF